MKDIFKRICYAQIASDGGKSIETLKNYNEKIWLQGYKAKDREIKRALELIESGNGFNVKYYIAKDYFSKNLGGWVFIVYFNYKDSNGTRKQISFHSFNQELENKVNSNYVTRWDRNSSRENVIDLLEKRY